jgi:enoyl-CoA hydratase/carnithine racemase
MLQPGSGSLHLSGTDVAGRAFERVRSVAILATKLASKSRHTLTIGKSAFYQQAELSLAQAYAYAGEVMVANLQASDAQEGIGAFIDKRPPVWCNG